MNDKIVVIAAIAAVAIIVVACFGILLVLDKGNANNATAANDQGNNSSNDTSLAPGNENVTNGGASSGNDSNSVPSPTSISETSGDNDSTPAPKVQGEPNLWMEYTTSWSGDAISYGMPYPGSNQFSIETNKYGEDQPSGEYHITNIIHISNVAPRSGNTGPAEGSVEIRTYDPSSQVSRLVNLYSDGNGGAYGVLVDNYATWNYSWSFQNGVNEKFTQTFSVNITKLGSHTIDVYAIDDHGDGTYAVVSNHLTRTFTTYGGSLINGGAVWEEYTNNVPYAFTLMVSKNSYVSNIHGLLPYVYSGDVNIELFMEGTTDYSLALNGQTLSGTVTTMDGVQGLLFDLGAWNANSGPVSYSMTFTVTDGASHYGHTVLTDKATGDAVGYGYVDLVNKDRW